MLGIGVRPEIPDLATLFRVAFRLASKAKALVVIDELPWAATRHRDEDRASAELDPGHDGGGARQLPAEARPVRLGDATVSRYLTTLAELRIVRRKLPPALPCPAAEATGS
jgi:hypothetical protein